MLIESEVSLCQFGGPTFLLKMVPVQGMTAECLSKSTEVSVRPKPIERQIMPICQRVFCEETLTALRVHPGLDKKDCEGSVQFIEKVLSVWKMNVVIDCYTLWTAHRI